MRFWIAVPLVIVASVAAFMQPPRSDALRPPPLVDSIRWWFYPLEWNATNRLSKIECSLFAIQAVPDSNIVWAAGNKGMVVTTTDGGETWSPKNITGSNVRFDKVTSTPSPNASPEPTPTRPPPAAASGIFNWLDVVPTAVAAETGDEQSPGDRQQPTPTVDPKPLDRQQGPPPTPTPIPRSTATPRPRPIATPTPVQTGLPGQATPSSSPSTGFLPAPNQIAPEAEKLIAVRASSGTSGEAISTQGRYFRTTDGGSSWESFPLLEPDPFSQPLRSAFFPDGTKRSRVSAFVEKTGRVIAFLPKETSAGYNGPAPSLGIDNVYAVQLLGDELERVFAVGEKGAIHQSTDFSYSWKPLTPPGPENLRNVYFVSSARGWVVGDNGAIYATADGGSTWSKQASNTTSQLNAVTFLPDGQHGWIAGNDGLILSTSDGGATWVQRTQGKSENAGRYLRFPAPWYFLTLLLVGLLVWRKPKDKEEPTEESVADVLVSDRPLEEAAGDVLAFNAIARGLSRFLRNDNTMPPLTIAITGEWGTGKSSLMNLLRADLRSYKFRPVWFNAWHHQKEEHMLASLLENIKLQAVPRWWTSRGLRFRARLLAIRGVRQWLPVVLLLFFIYVLGIYYYHAGGSLDTRLSRVLSAPDFTTLLHKFTPANILEVLPLLAGIITFGGAVWRGITAFGVKPASLLAGVSRGASIRGLEAKTSFRQKFASEFNDVTRALGKRSLLIFIDDLDRCRPENVLETLEAVNFLTTSGECFVVIGMAREYVERCVGRAFNEVAQEMVDDLTDEKDETDEDIAKQKRIEFARQYLDKLVNIEVPVPAPKQSQSLALLVASTRELELGKPSTNWQRFKLSLLTFIETRWRVLMGILVASGLLFVGYHAARRLAAPYGSEVAVAVAGPTSQPTAAPSPVASPDVTPTPQASPSPTSVATAVPTPDTESAEVIDGGRGYFSSAFMPVIALLALVWLGTIILTRRPGLVVKDSPRFIEALEIWHPLVFARQYTPRATKRFMNFVRYLAMRQRRQTESGPPLQEFLANMKGKLAGVKTAADVIAEVANAETGVQQIPDEVLVALAALQHLNPECLAEMPGPAADTDAVWPRAIAANNPLRPLFEKAREDHQAKFGNWATLNQYRERFLEMTANVQVR